jgi:hypothetical protein
MWRTPWRFILWNHYVLGFDLCPSNLMHVSQMFYFNINVLIFEMDPISFTGLNKKKSITISRNRPWMSVKLRDAKDPTLFDSRHTDVIKFVNPTHRQRFTPQKHYLYNLYQIIFLQSFSSFCTFMCSVINGHYRIMFSHWLLCDRNISCNRLQPTK